MTFLPIVGRELRVAARRASTYWSRVSAALLCTVISACLLGFSGVPVSQLGMKLFRILAWLSLLYCAVAGPCLTADSVSRERREGTLGLLFLTDLKGYDVVLGKLVSSSLGCLYSLLAIFPILGLSLLLGGVTAWQFWSTVMALLSMLFFSLTAGMLASTLCENPRRAVACALLIILPVTLGPLILAGVLWDYSRGPTPVISLVPFASPAAALTLLDPKGTLPGQVARVGYWMSVGSGQLAGWLCLGLSSLLVTRVWQDRPRASGGRRWRLLWERWTLGAPDRREVYRRRLLELNPFFWLVSRDRLKPAYVWAVLALAVGALVWGVRRPLPTWQSNNIYLHFSLVLHGCIKLWIGVVATHRLADDYHSGALEHLLSTPISIRNILAGQIMAFRRQFGGPILAMLGIDGVCCYAVTLQSESFPVVLIVLPVAVHMVLLVVDARTILWLGSWMAVRTRNSLCAVVGALFRILVLPWLVFIALTVSFNELELDASWNLDTMGVRILGHSTWLGIALATDLLYLAYAHTRLRRDFRTAAAQRFAPHAPGLLHRLIGPRCRQAVG